MTYVRPDRTHGKGRNQTVNLVYPCQNRLPSIASAMSNLYKNKVDEGEGKLYPPHPRP